MGTNNDDLEILQLVQRIHSLSSEHPKGPARDEDILYFKMAKIRELANALLPRLEAKHQGKVS